MGSRNARRISTALVILAAFVFFAALANTKPLNFYDEGIVLEGGYRVARGDVPYRDFFALYGPGQFWMLGCIFYAYGPSLIAARLYVAATMALTSGCIFYLGSYLAGTRWAILAWVILSVGALSNLTFGYPAVPATLFALAGGIALANYFDFRKNRLLIAAGGTISLCGVFRHDFGVYAMLAAASALTLFSLDDGYRTWLKRLGLLLLGVTLIAGPVVGYLLAVVPFDLLYHDLWSFPCNVYPRVRALPWPTTLPNPALLTEGPLSPAEYLTAWLGLFASYLPLLIFAAAAGTLFYRCRSRAIAASDCTVIYLLVLGLGLLKHASIRVNYAQLVPVIIVASVLLVWLASSAWSRLYLQIVVSIASALLLAWGGFYLLIGAQPIIQASRPLTTEQEHLTLFIQQHTEPGEHIFVGNTRHDLVVTSQIAVYFLTLRPSATRYHELHPGQVTTASVQQEIVHELEQKDIRLVVLYDEGDCDEPNESSVSTGIKLLDEYIQDHFEHVSDFGKFAVLMRKAPARSADNQ
jgi:hypothetical protein